MATPLVPGYDYLVIGDDGKFETANDVDPVMLFDMDDADGTLAHATSRINLILARLRELGWL